MKHTHRWIESLMANMDAKVDEETRVKILENCGRSCIPTSFLKKARSCQEKSEDLDDFLERLGKIWNHLKREGGDIYVEYDKCYCPLVKTFPGELSSSWCNCSRGWLLELFESALGRPVGVELEKSIRQGDDICRFKIRL